MDSEEQLIVSLNLWVTCIRGKHFNRVIQALFFSNIYIYIYCLDFVFQDSW